MSHSLIRSVVLVAVVASFSCAGEGQTAAKAPTIDQSLEMYSVGSPKISPDGKRVVYEQTRTNWEANAFETDLWIADVATGERHQLTTTGHSCNPAEWSPDGKWIAFVSDRPGALPKSPEGKRQLWIMPADGGEAQQLTKMEQGVGGFDWAPDSRRIAFSAEAPEPKAMKDRKDTFGDYHVIHADYEMTHLWLLDLPKTDSAGRVSAVGEPKELTKEDSYSVEEFSFSPDGMRIAFSAARDPDLISSFSKDIYVVTVADGAVKKIVDTPGPDSDPRWSPDGKQIAYTTSNGAKYFFYANQKIAVVDAEGGAPRVLSDAFDEDPDLVKWSPEGIYFSGLQKMSSSLYLLDPASKSIKKMEMPGSEIAGAFTFSKDFKQVAYRGAGANEYAEIYAGSVASGAPAKLTNAGAQEAGFTVAKREVVRWKSGDGTEIEGVLYKPADFSPTKKYPLLVVIHGGPTGIDMPMVSADRYYPIERFVAKGALVLRPELSRFGGLWREVSRAECAQPGRGRLCRRNFGRGLSDRAGICGQEPRGVDGLERGRIHFRVHHHVKRQVQGGERGRGYIRLDDLLREHRHHAVHSAISPRDALGRSRDLQADVTDHLHREGEDAHTDSAGERGQESAGAGQFRIATGAGGSRCSSEDGAL